ncbi:pseudaminic acid biosynthesis-associated methylase [Desulfonatronum thiodismutans]|uniref:pseudaminic acid biosynthesis-associated methylase n=1 Tax=Desulfonatronum thiodismutans TaxID=159290 RepID=UPI0004ABDFC6|nr:pseudaminic acid biosynthesis-associated methylase [Desulfonatronum thiodismutans]
MNETSYATEQEAFWAGQFGAEYIDRNKSHQLIAANISLFNRALRMAGPIHSCIEFGANIGLNLAALRMLYPSQKQYAVEINRQATAELRAHIPEDNIFEMSILDFDAESIPDGKCDLVLSKGVLIHINPDMLQHVYSRLYQATNRHILLAEYYNPSPVDIPYRGHKGKLFKRDFAGEMLDRFPDLKLIDYGFVYHREKAFPQDDINWFLLEKITA